MICEAFKERNYLYAYDIYMRLAVGTHIPTAFSSLSCLGSAASNCQLPPVTCESVLIQKYVMCRLLLGESSVLCCAVLCGAVLCGAVLSYLVVH